MDHPLIQHKIGIIRREETGSKDFRTLVSEIAMLMCYEATRDLKLADVEIDTPICKTTVKELKGKKLAVVPILRAGLGMVDGMLAMIPAAKVGENFGAIVGPDFKRNENGDILIDPQTGLPQYDKSNHVLGNASWDWTGGLGTTLTYKNLSLSALFDIKVGADLYSMSARASYESGKSKETLAGREEWYRSEEQRQAAGIAKGSPDWTPTGGFIAPGVIDNGDGTYRPNDIYINPEDYWMSVCRNAPSMFIYDNSYIKCREITLSYRVPQSWLKNVVKGLTVSFVARNPFIVWKNIPNIDPDSNYNNTTGMGLEYGSLPSRRSYGFNVNLKF